MGQRERGEAVHIEGLPAAGLLVGYLGLLISLSRVGKSLEKAGFLLRSAPVCFRGRQVALVCLGAVGVGVLLCGLGRETGPVVMWPTICWAGTGRGRRGAFFS